MELFIIFLHTLMESINDQRQRISSVNKCILITSMPKVQHDIHVNRISRTG